jgi:outer membrane protein TolC
MKFLLFTLMLLCSSLGAMNLTALIESSLSKNPSLDAINARIKASGISADVADQFSNPELSLTKNTLSSSEKMSQTVMTFKQKIEYYNKRSVKKQVALADTAIEEEKLHFAKVTLVANIKTEAYALWELQELRNIIDNYIKFTRQNIELYESYTSVSDNQHMGIMKAELSLADLQIEKSKLDAKIYGSYARLSYLAAFEVKNLKISLTIAHKPELLKLEKELNTNPTLAIKEKEIQKQNALVSLADRNRYPDFNLIAGYAYRENFDNYFNFGVALTLPIYGTEKAKEQEQRALQLSHVSQKEDVKISVNTMLRAYYAQMLSAYNIYHIVQDKALPQIVHMFELSNSSISTGGDLFKYIDVLFQKLSLEQKSINAVASYNKAQAKISELAGDLK